ncbi:MAG: acetyl-CoA carboxylase biotin carboxyl carrier protein subunit [Clostridia bacterium]|nr:acetyl-CoA carboxylase biotin carboxyl carrier protein subunit [Clostridia bacterium]
MRKFNIKVNGSVYEVEVEEVGGATYSAPVQAAAPVAAPAPAPTPTPAPAAAPAGSANVVAPMPGTVVSIKVKAGDKVSKDTVVAVLEAMKMENEIFAGIDGTVANVVAAAGQSVNTGDVLVSIN